jgi:hypothetical protein
MRVMVFQQPHRFPQQGPAHPFALDQFGLGPHQIARLQILRHHGLGDMTRHRLRALSLARLGQDDRVGKQLPGGTSAAEEVGLRLEVLAHAVAGQAGIAGHQRLGDFGVGVLCLAPDRPAEVLPIRRVQLGHLVEDVDEQREPGVAADLRHQQVQSAGVAPRLKRALLGEAAQRRQVSLVGALGRQLAGELFQDDARLEDLVQRGVDPVQIEHHRVAHGTHRRLGDDESPAGPTSGAGDLLVFDETYRLPEDGPAHVIALEQVGLGPEHLTDRPAHCHDILDDAIRHLGGALGVRRGAGARHLARGGGRRHTPSVPGIVHFSDF